MSCAACDALLAEVAALRAEMASERAERADTARVLVELERLRSLHLVLVSDEPSVGDSYTNGAIVKKIVSYSPEDDHFMWHDGKRISRSVLMSDPMWRRVP